MYLMLVNVGKPPAIIPFMNAAELNQHLLDFSIVILVNAH